MTTSAGRQLLLRRFANRDVVDDCHPSSSSAILLTVVVADDDDGDDVQNRFHTHSIRLTYRRHSTADDRPLATRRPLVVVLSDQSSFSVLSKKSGKISSYFKDSCNIDELWNSHVKLATFKPNFHSSQQVLHL